METSNIVLEMDVLRYIVDPSICGNDEESTACGVRVFLNKNGNYPVVETTLREWDRRAGHEFVERVNDDKLSKNALLSGDDNPKFYVKGKALFKKESKGDSGEIVMTFESEEAAKVALDERQFTDAKKNGPLFFDCYSDAEKASNRYTDIVESITDAIATTDCYASPWNRHMLHDDMARSGVTGAFIRETVMYAIQTHCDCDEELAESGLADYHPVITAEMHEALENASVWKLLRTRVAAQWAMAKNQFEEEDDEIDC